MMVKLSYLVAADFIEVASSSEIIPILPAYKAERELLHEERVLDNLLYSVSPEREDTIKRFAKSERLLSAIIPKL